jgi:hypothetical protein
MAFVMGISSAQASLLKVQEDFIESSGVYAIVDFTSFHIFCQRAIGKIGRGVGALSVKVFYTPQSYIWTLRHYFWVKLRFSLTIA